MKENKGEKIRIKNRKRYKRKDEGKIMKSKRKVKK